MIRTAQHDADIRSKSARIGESTGFRATRCRESTLIENGGMKLTETRQYGAPQKFHMN
jgi:hypothetical protein